jgi:hypothetical protein
MTNFFVKSSLLLVFLFSTSVFFCLGQTPKLNAKYICEKSNQINKRLSDGKVINNQEYLYKNLKIYLIDVDLDIGVGKIQVLDDDRKMYFQFDLLNLSKSECGFFKLPSQNNETYCVMAFGADSGTSRVTVYFCVHKGSDKTLLMVQSNHTIDNLKYTTENWYYDLKMIK